MNPFCLFATHLFELTALEHEMPDAVGNLHVAVLTDSSQSPVKANTAGTPGAIGSLGAMGVLGTSGAGGAKGLGIEQAQLEELVFLHEVQPGACEKSFGVQCAKLASFPEQVLQVIRPVHHFSSYFLFCHWGTQGASGLRFPANRNPENLTRIIVIFDRFPTKACKY